MEQRLKTWFVLIALGILVPFIVIMAMKAARLHEFWVWSTGISLFLNFFLVGMVGNARGALMREMEVTRSQREQLIRQVRPEAIPVSQPHQTTFEIEEYPSEEHRPRAPKEAERIGREAEEAERRRREEEYQRSRKKVAGYKQGHMNPSPTPTGRGYYFDVNGFYREVGRQGRG